ncbi:unnamed protein product, partial [Allacma fusca]
SNNNCTSKQPPRARWFLPESSPFS